MLKSPRVRKPHRRRPRSSIDSFTERERTTIVVALRFLEERWSNELCEAAELRRPACLRSCGEVVEQDELLTPAEIRDFCKQLASGQSAQRERLPHLVTFEIPCVTCGVPMQPQPHTVTGDNAGESRTVPVLTCPQCGNTLASCEPVAGTDDNPRKSPPRFQHP